MAGSRIIFRVDEDTEGLINAAAEARKESVSTYARNASLTAVEHDKTLQNHSFDLAEMIKEAARLTKEVDNVRAITAALAETIKELSTSIAVERAANRVLHEQTLRMAVRAAHAALNIASNRGFEDNDDIFQLLGKEADDSFQKGLVYVENGMMKAREEMEQTLRLGVRA